MLSSVRSSKDSSRGETKVNGEKTSLKGLQSYDSDNLTEERWETALCCICPPSHQLCTHEIFPLEPFMIT